LGSIESCKYDGSDRQVVIQHPEETWLNGLDIDLGVQQLWWTDRTSMSLMTADIDGSGDHSVIQGDVQLGNESHTVTFYGVAVDQQGIYFTDWNAG
jgi:hypothetical protein